MLNTLLREQDETDGLLVTEPQAARTALPVPAAELALWVVLATVTMLFAGFTSAYLVRRTATDWVPIYSPPILWVNTGLLILSSVGFEMAKGARREGRRQGVRFWLLTSAASGVAFVVGQILAWQQLSASGILLPTSPHSSFFYMLTGVHAVHVLGGIAGLLYVLWREWNVRPVLSAASPIPLVAAYWHFVTGVWLFLYVLLFIWR
jgi:cytochrome c oxidase subunit 3